MLPAVGSGIPCLSRSQKREDGADQMLPELVAAAASATSTSALSSSDAWW